MVGPAGAGDRGVANVTPADVLVDRWNIRPSAARMSGYDDEIVRASARQQREVVGMATVSRGFVGRRLRGQTSAGRLPPGQYDVGQSFPVLSAGPTPRQDLDTWDFRVGGKIEKATRWSWREFQALPREDITVDIHCVTSWSKFDTRWSGVSVDTLLEQVTTEGAFVTAFSDGGYTTNLPLADVTDGKAWVVDTYAGAPLSPEHGGPARLLVPHLYFWKSAKWVRGLILTVDDEPGFWEGFGYHNYGDPWREQRYAGD